MPLKLVRRPRSPYWVIRGSIAGSRVEESTGTADRALAEEIRAQREAALYKQSIYGPAATSTFANAALSYMEAGGSRRFLSGPVDYFGVIPLVQIDQDAIDRGARKVLPDASPSTRNRQFYTPVSAVLTHAAKRGWCTRPLIDRPKQPEGRIRWLRPDEAERLLECCAPHLRPFVLFLLYTGARAGEALWLDWRDVDLARAHVQFPKTKTGKARGVPLHRRVIAALATLGSREGEVFRKADGRPYERPTRAEDTSAGSRIKTAFAGACRRAGIVDFSPHDCRHTWATWFYAANRDLAALVRLGGWANERMAMRYTHVNVAELAPSINRLPGGGLGDLRVLEAKSA